MIWFSLILKVKLVHYYRYNVIPGSLHNTQLIIEAKLSSLENCTDNSMFSVISNFVVVVVVVVFVVVVVVLIWIGLHGIFD